MSLWMHIFLIFVNRSAKKCVELAFIWCHFWKLGVDYGGF